MLSIPISIRGRNIVAAGVVSLTAWWWWSSRKQLERLLTRIRGEYLEMPGLSLTIRQACRLWQLNPRTCESVLRALTRQRVLYRTVDGRFLLVN